MITATELLKKNILLIAVFITGACVLIVEVVATRILSPFYGNTIFMVSSVISVILAALSLGYYVGGRTSDRHPSFRWFFGIIALSGLMLLFLHLLGAAILPILGRLLPISTGPLVTAVLLFFVPAFLLGMLSPYAVKIQSINVPHEGVGSVAGKIFFWSTLGSIAGSLLAGFVLIPHIGVDQIIIANSLILFFLGALPFLVLGKKEHRIMFTAILLLFVGIPIAASHASPKNVLYTKDGIYEKITIYDGSFHGHPVRFLEQDRTSSAAMFLDSNDPKRSLVYDYTKYYALYKVFDPDARRALVIGGGAYSIPKALLAESPDMRVDVAEIEPALYELAQKFFHVDANSRLHNYEDDGRHLLTLSRENYDLIFSDVYYSLFSIPAHFTTREFFTVAKNKLNKKGIFIANMIGGLSRERSLFIMSEIKTFQTVFPNSYFLATDSLESTRPQNIIFVGYNNDAPVDLGTPLIVADRDPITRSLKSKLIDVKKLNLSPYSVLTDNYAPVEYLTGQVLQATFK